MLHNDKELFRQAVLLTSQNLNIDSGIVEKDYYVTMFLKELSKFQPNIIFKGGTSLSKCYNLIKRFSEDIDLSLYSENSPTEKQRKELKKNIMEVIKKFGFSLTNPDAVGSNRKYNKYVIDFPSAFEYMSLKQHLIVETSVFVKAYPCEKRLAGCYIYDYFKQSGKNDIIEEYDLEAFELYVQTLDRTFIDKLFALGDYYLSDKISEHSRHIYDLYKIYPIVKDNENLKALYNNVRKQRQSHEANLSANENVNMRELLQEIVDKEIYKSDYETITKSLLFEDIPYETAIKSLHDILSSDLL